MTLEPDDSQLDTVLEPSSIFSSDELTAALGAEQFLLVDQPTFDLHVGAFADVEAFVRRCPLSHGVISPCDFIDELEVSGQIVPVRKWTLDVA